MRFQDKDYNEGPVNGAFFSTNQHLHGGEWDGSPESLIGCDFERREAKKEEKKHFQRLHRGGGYTGATGGLKQSNNKNTKHCFDLGTAESLLAICESFVLNNSHQVSALHLL